MKTKYLLPLFALAACGSPQQAARVADAIVGTMNTNALADLPSCPSDMTLLPAAPGHAATCIDSAPRDVLAHSFAVLACATAGATLCNSAELTHARDSVGITTNTIWAAESSGGNALVWVNGAPWGTPATANHYQFYCCSR